MVVGSSDPSGRGERSSDFLRLFDLVADGSGCDIFGKIVLLPRERESFWLSIYWCLRSCGCEGGIDADDADR